MITVYFLLHRKKIAGHSMIESCWSRAMVPIIDVPTSHGCTGCISICAKARICLNNRFSL